MKSNQIKWFYNINTIGSVSLTKVWSLKTMLCGNHVKNGSYFIIFLTSISVLFCFVLYHLFIGLRLEFLHLLVSILPHNNLYDYIWELVFATCYILKITALHQSRILHWNKAAIQYYTKQFNTLLYTTLHYSTA